MKPTFTLSIQIDATLDYDEIWPDGDAPEKPTVDDVKEALLGPGWRDIRDHHYISDKLADWDIRPQLGDLTITDDREWQERMAKELPGVLERMKAGVKEDEP